MHKITVKDISRSIDNDEGLYLWWKREKMDKRAFIRQNKAKLEEAINRVLIGSKPPHYLAYGPY